MRRLTINVSESEGEALLRLAMTERRRPQDQAAVLIAEGLRQRGVDGMPPVSPHTVANVRPQQETPSGRAAA
jgi:hypothetical protein